VNSELCKFHIIEDERLVSKMESKTNCLRRVKEFDGLTLLTLTQVVKVVM